MPVPLGVYIEKRPFRRQELPLSGGNGNPTSGCEAKERCAADHATRPAAHRSRVDHTSISAAPDDLRSRSGHAQLQFACIDQHVDQSMFHSISLFALWCLNQYSVRLHVRRLHRCLLRIRPLASEKKTSPDENLCSSPVKPTTTPHTRLREVARALRSSLKITSASFARRFVPDGHGEAGICSNNGKL